MDGVLLIDKPGGLTSHDVVAKMRRVLNERSIGHTGTLDPMATGLLVLVVGQATRLASLLTGRDKTYEATIRLGQRTTTEDADGDPVGPATRELPDDTAVAQVLSRFTGTFAQVPSSYSAKKVDGTRAYRLARQDKPVNLAPVNVTVRDLTSHSRAGTDVQVRVTATAGFYVRALARDIGNHLGCGAHLSSLRRTVSGTFRVEDALTLERAEGDPPAARAALIASADALPDLPSVEVTDEGLKRVRHGNFVGPQHLAAPWPGDLNPQDHVRVLSDGRLIALARPRAGALHPAVVLG